MLFPENVGQFKRVQITQFSPAEKGVGIGYNLNNPVAPVVTTVYVYPAPRLISIGSPPDVVETGRAGLFQRHLEGIKQDIMRAHPDARLISDEDITLTEAGQTHKGRKVTFEFAYTFGQYSQDSISQLYLFQNGTWMIKYRVTFPRATSSKVEKAIAEFLNKLQWPEKGNS